MSLCKTLYWQRCNRKNNCEAAAWADELLTSQVLKDSELIYLMEKAVIVLFLQTKN